MKEEEKDDDLNEQEGQKCKDFEDDIFQKGSTNTLEKSPIQIGDNNVANYYDSSNKPYILPTNLKLNNEEENKFDVEKEARNLANNLIKKRFIIINCAHSVITKSFKHTIAKNSLFDKAFIKVNGAFNPQTNVSFLHFINDCKKKFLNEEKSKLLLFLSDDGVENNTLLRELKLRPTEGKDNIIQRLEERVCIVYFTYHKDKNYLVDSAFCKNFHNVQTTNIYYRNHDAIDDSIVELIEVKRQAGHLSTGEKEFLLELDKIKVSKFKRYIHRLGKNSIKFNNLFKDKNLPLARYVLLVATLFHRLSPESFRDYVRVLIQDKKKVKVNGSKISLSELWDEDADIILEECGLNSYEIDNQYCIDFATSEDAERCKNVVYKYANFMDQKSRLLIEQKQLFSESTSIDSHNNMFTAIAQLATLFKSYYGNELLIKWLVQLEVQRKEVFRLINIIDDLRSYRHHIQKLIDKVSKIRLNEDLLRLAKKVDPIKFKNDYNNYLKEHQLAKFLLYKQEQLPENTSVKDVLVDLGNLKNDLLSHTNEINDELNRLRYGLGRNIYLFVNLLQDVHNKYKTNSRILDFFHISFQSLHRNFIVLDVLNEFHHKIELDNFFEYYEQALKKAPRNTKDIISDALVRFILKNPSGFYKTISKIKDWFPKVSKPTEEFSQLEKLSLRCLYQSLIIQMNIDEESNTNDIINSNTYQMLFENSEEFQKDIGFIIINVFKHLDVLETSIKKNGLEAKHTVENFQYEITQLFQSWYLLLHNLDSKNTKEEKAPLLIDIMQKVLSPKQHKVLIKNLKKKQEHYNHQIIANKNIKEQKRIKERRGHIIKLINFFKK